MHSHILGKRKRQDRERGYTATYYVKLPGKEIGEVEETLLSAR